MNRQAPTRPAPGDDDVVVIGAGIIGLSVALEVAGRGRHVVLVDRGPTDGGCATGSAGHLVPSHVIPLAAPGALWSAAGDLIRRNGALSVSWTTAPSFWRWIIGFARSCNRRSVESAAPALGDLASLSTEIWDQWLTGSGADVATDGLFDVYADPRAFERAGEHAELLRRWGVDVRLLDPAEALTCEPALRGPVAGGVLLPDDRCIRPGRVVASLVQRVEASGVALVPDTDVVGFVTERDRVAGVRTSSGVLPSAEVVLAAGAWSGAIVRLLGQHLPMTAARGMSLTVDRPVVGPRRAMLLGEHHVAVAPLGDELRLSGWFQLNNYDTHPSAKRIARLEAIARQRLELDDSLTVRQRWAGLRPVTPDGVPIIGRLQPWSNVTIAAGHSMTGLTMAPGTGRIVAQIIDGRRPDIAVDRFSPGRFQ